MKKVVIRMEQRAQGAHVYPVQLFFEDGSADWLKNPLATTTIPEDLSIPNPPNDPVSGDPIQGQQIREAFLNQGGASLRFEAWGDYLYQLLFQGDVGTEWDKLRDLYPREIAGSEGLRTVLDIKPEGLRLLPWELIFKAPMPLFFDPLNPFSRGILKSKPTGGITFTWPIHVLIVVGSKEDDDTVNAVTEIEAIQKAFIKSPVPIDWHISYRPKKEELQKLIEEFKPQIFHFIGHGKEIGYSYLELTDKNGKAAPEEWTVSDIAIHLMHWQPRLAFANACRTSSPGGPKNSWDIARAFSSAGVPAVLGMQADIQGAAAAAFSGKLYESIAKGDAIDRAVAQARAAVSNLSSLQYRDWALATLYLQQLPEQILATEPAIDEQRSEKFKIDSKLKETRDFVGRARQRRKLWYGVDEVIYRKDEFSRLCIVVGSDLIGKTALVQASMKICALRDRRVSYVDIGYQTTKDFVEILQIIRKGDAKASDIICAPLPDAPFAEFDKKYGDLLKQPDAAKTLAVDTQQCEQLFNAYKAALVEIAATQPLIIVLDHLSVEWDQFNKILVEKLLTPIAKNLLPKCSAILVCTAEEFEKRLAKELKDMSAIVEVPAWKPERYVPLAQQICLYNDIDPKKVEQIINGYSQNIDSDWKPVSLRKLVELVKSIPGF